MVINQLTLQDVLKIKAVRIKPDGNIVKISGKNAQGKSSILSGIELVLRGPSAFPEKPIRDGATQGAGEIDLGDIIVTRHLDPHKLVVKYKGSDEKIARPQQFLDALLSKYTCDPIKLLNLSPSDRMEEVRHMFGIDFSSLDKEYDDLYSERRDLKRDIKSLKELTKSYDESADTGAIDDSKLLEDHKKAREVNKANDTLRFQLKTEREKVLSLKGEEKALEEKLAAVREEISKRTESGKVLSDKVSSLTDIDEEALFNEIQRVQKHNASAEANKKVAGFVAELKSSEKSLESLESKIEAIKEKKAQMLANVKSPLDGLLINGNSLLYNGVPLEQASQAEQIKACLALSVAGDPDIKVVLIRQASLLDSDSLEIVAREADEKGLQVWLEIVGDDDPLSFIIEDGEIVHEPEVKEKLS